LESPENGHEDKPKISISLDQEAFDWLQTNVRNRSAFIRDLISEYRKKTRVDPKHASVTTTLDRLKGLGLILTPGRLHRTLLEIGLKHDPETVTKEVKESGRLLGIYFSSHLRDQNWLETFQYILQDLFLDVNQITIHSEDEVSMNLHVVSEKHTEGALFLLGQFLEEAFSRLGFKIAEQSMIFEQEVGMLTAKYARSA
jgi:hypothetical protein